MAKMVRWVLGGADHCPSCLIAGLQVHPLIAWELAGIVPQSEALYCRKACQCRFEEVETDKEVGNLEDIPTRTGLDTAGGQAPAIADTNRAQLGVTGEVNAAGEFEVMAITAGEGNGWKFSEDALRESLALWDGAECFVDHSWGGHSLRDLAGLLVGPTWDKERSGIKARLKPMGPSSALLQELGRQMVSTQLLPDTGNAVLRPRVGFSADVVFTSQGRDVKKILRVLSVDLVFNPARGGAFLRALNSIQGSGVMGMEDEKEKSEGGNPQPEQVQLSEDLQAVKTLLEVQKQQAQLAAEAEEARKVRAQMCGYLLDSGLAASKLPGVMQDSIRSRFAGRVFEAPELTAAIEEGRKLVSDLTGASVIQGPGRVHGMLSSEDQFTAALYDMLEAERPEALKNVKAAKLSGIREMYTLMTGDYEFSGGFNGNRVQFAATIDLPNVLKNAMNKLIVQHWQELGRSGYRWWEPIVDVQHFSSLQQITGVLVGEVTALPVVLEGASYTPLPLKDSAEIGDWTKYGGYIGLTLEMFERDETHKLKQYPQKLASAGLRRISALVGSIFTANAGIGTMMTDTYNVFEAAHHANLGVAALSSAAWDAASSAIYSQPMLVGPTGTAPKLALDAKYLLVPRALRLTGWQLLYPNMEHNANIFSENMQKGEMGDVITVPEFSDANDWAAVADPKLAPGIMIAERFGLLPEIIIADGPQAGALFTNDEIRMKARHWLSVFVADYRPLYKANVV